MGSPETPNTGQRQRERARIVGGKYADAPCVVLKPCGSNGTENLLLVRLDSGEMLTFPESQVTRIPLRPAGLASALKRREMDKYRSAENDGEGNIIIS